MGAATKKTAASHVVMQGEEMACTHCGQRQKLAFPIDIGVFAAAAKAFTKTHRRCKPDPKVAAAEDQRRAEAAKDPGAWIRGGDTGTSSETIWSVMTGHPVARHGIPHDPSDFGRCYRLLQSFPSWRERLPEVAERHPIWIPFVREWDRMTALYEQELKRPDGRCPKLYEAMKPLVAEAFNR